MSEDIKSLALTMEKDVIARLEAENKQLRQTISAIQKSRLISDEEQVCVTQINILKEKSDERELNLDEVKRLDLLVKNLKLIRENSAIEAKSVPVNDAEEADLVRLARS